MEVILRLATKSRNSWLVSCFILYVFFICFFAVIYFCLYHSSPKDSFFIPSELVGGRFREAKRAMEQNIKRDSEALSETENVLKALLVLKRHLEGQTEDIPFTDENSNPQITIENYSFLFSSGMDGSSTWARFTIFDRGRKIFAQGLYDTISKDYLSPSAHIRRIAPIIYNHEEESKKKRRQIDENKQTLDNLERENSKILTFWDFLYFSTITQCTVGYGDILPDSTTVRMIVIVQIIVGLVIVTFFVAHNPAKGDLLAK